MKKAMATILASALVVSSLGGCSNSSSTTSTTAPTTPEASAETTAATTAAATQAEAGGNEAQGGELNIAVFKGGYGDEYWTEISKKFEEANAGVKVNMTSDPNLGAIIQPKLLAGDIPDFIFLPSTNPSGLVRALIKDKKLADITDVFETDGLKDKFIPGFLGTSSTEPYGDGKVYLAPLYYSALGLFYNKTLFTEANLTTPTTWDEFFALGDKVNQENPILGKDRALFTYQAANPGYMEALVIPAIASSAGAETMNNCFNYVEGAWKDPNVIKTLEAIAKIGTNGYMLEGTPGLDFTAAQTAVKTGDALFVPCGNWLPGEMKDIEGEKINDKDFEWGFSVAPVFDASGDKYLMSSFEEMYVHADAKNLDLAKKFLAFQYTDDAIKLNAEKSKGIPPIKGAVDMVKDSLDISTYESFKAFDEGFKPYIGNFAQVESNIIPRDEFYNMISSVIQGQTTAEEWANKMDEVSAQVRDKIVTAE